MLGVLASIYKLVVNVRNCVLLYLVIIEGKLTGILDCVLSGIFAGVLDSIN